MKYIVRFLCLLFLIKYISLDKYISVVMQRCYGNCNRKYCNVSVRCRPLNRTAKLTSMDFYFHPGITLEAPIEIEVIAYKKFRTQYRQHMLKIRTELCAQLNNTNHPFFSVMWKIKFVGNMLNRCPIKGHRYILPYAPTYEHYPLVPVGEWRVDFLFTKYINNSKEFITSWSEFYEVKPKGAEEF